MKKFLLVVISLVYLLTFVACGTSTDIDTSPSKFIESVDISSHGSVSTATSSSNVCSEIPPHACYDKSKDGAYFGGDGYCDLCGAGIAKITDHIAIDPLGTSICGSCNKPVALNLYDHYYNDEDSDGICDWCRNSDHDDVCNKSLHHSCYSKDGTYSDSNFDRLCDVCADDLAHYCNDTNNDDKCDTCFAYFGITHQDTTGDGYCDIHKKCKTYLLEHNHIDKNTDHKCDLCYLPLNKPRSNT